MSDERHNSTELFNFVNEYASSPDRPHDFYWGLAMMPLFVFGHREKIIELGNEMMKTVPQLWSARVAYCIHFYVALSYLALHVENPELGLADEQMENILKHKEIVDFARFSCDANYGMWSLLLEALISEARGDYVSAMQAFEVSLNPRYGNLGVCS